MLHSHWEGETIEKLLPWCPMSQSAGLQPLTVHCIFRVMRWHWDSPMFITVINLTQSPCTETDIKAKITLIHVVQPETQRCLLKRQFNHRRTQVLCSLAAVQESNPSAPGWHSSLQTDSDWLQDVCIYRLENSYLQTTSNLGVIVVGPDFYGGRLEPERFTAGGG